MAKVNKSRVLIGDRQPIFRTGLSHLLSKQPGISVVGEVADGQEALKLLAECKPSVLLLDSMMSQVTDSNLLNELQQKHKDVRVILLTPSDREQFEDSLVGKTAGIIPKQASLDSLLECIRKVEAGQSWNNGASSITTENAGGNAAPTIQPAPEVSPLSIREKQVVSLVSQGYRNKEIAERMFISEQTVKNHLHNIFDKLGVSDRLELALYAIHKNLHQG